MLDTVSGRTRIAFSFIGLIVSLLFCQHPRPVFLVVSLLSGSHFGIMNEAIPITMKFALLGMIFPPVFQTRLPFSVSFISAEIFSIALSVTLVLKFLGNRISGRHIVTIY